MIFRKVYTNINSLKLSFSKLLQKLKIIPFIILQKNIFKLAMSQVDLDNKISNKRKISLARLVTDHSLALDRTLFFTIDYIDEERRRISLVKPDCFAKSDRTIVFSIDDDDEELKKRRKISLETVDHIN